MGDHGTIIQLEDGWKHEIKEKALDRLEEVLNNDFKTTDKKLFSNQEYSHVYTICYNMCTQRTPFNWSEQLYQRHGDTISSYLERHVLPTLRDKHGVYLLQELVKRWGNHKIMNKWMKNFFMYLDRFYVKYHQLPPLEQAGLRHFRSRVFDCIKSEVTNAIITLVNAERDGEQLDRGLVRSVTEIYDSMGMGTIDVYVHDLEEPLQLASREYFNEKASQWLETDSLPEYLIKAERCLAEESLRVRSYLNTSSETKLLKEIEVSVLQQREMALLEKDNSGFKCLLVNHMKEDLARLFRLFSRLSEGLNPIADMFRLHIIECGNEKIASRVNRYSNTAVTISNNNSSNNKDAKDNNTNNNKDESDDPQFIKDLIVLHDHFLALVNEQFSGHGSFQKAMKDAFTDILNRDFGKAKMADLLGNYCDRLLKSNSTERLSDSEIEDSLEKVVQLFSFMVDKDMFAESYRQLLSKRLLNQRSASDDMERLMISKMKLRCGAQFTAKMEGMISDLTIGNEQSTQFARFCNDHEESLQLNKVDFTVQVLTTGYWPSFKIVDLTLPVSMQRCISAFGKYYEETTTHRKLKWVHTLGNASVRANYTKTSYELQVTTLQAVVLMAFNDVHGNNGNAVISFAELMKVLNIPEEILKRVLHSLSCAKFVILKKLNGPNNVNSNNNITANSESNNNVGEMNQEEPASTPNSTSNNASKESKVRNTDLFEFNSSFHSPLRRFRIPMASLEDVGGGKRVEEDRSIAMEAAIVRIMKSRKVLQHQQLVGEVLTQLAFFRPDPKIVKRRIEALIDREYLERDTDNPSVYKYLA